MCLQLFLADNLITYPCMDYLLCEVELIIAATPRCNTSKKPYREVTTYKFTDLVCIFLAPQDQCFPS